MTSTTVAPLRHNTAWIRDPRNPVLPPQDPAFDSRLCMNPWVVASGEEYQLFYAGEGEDGRRRICVATAPVTDVADWTRQGPEFERGEHGEFDGAWCVLPHVVDHAPGKRRIYYTGNSGIGRSLDRFPGLGFAESTDRGPFVKATGNPVITPSRRPGDPDARGIAGGSVLHTPGANPQWRFYYTGCPTVGDDVFLDQQKTICLATSDDGVDWHKHGAVLLRDHTRDYEDIAVAGPVVRQHESGLYQMWYSAIGTRWGYYSICYAESTDGVTWSRGPRYGDNLQFGPTISSMSTWDGQMVEYPTVVDAPEGLRLFYAGNGYGRTGIGTAVATPMRATLRDQESIWLTATSSGSTCAVRLVVELDGSPLRTDLDWYGPDANATLWARQQFAGGTVRHTVCHTGAGVEIRTVISNRSDRELSVRANPTIAGTTAALEVRTAARALVPATSNAEILSTIETRAPSASSEELG